MLISLVDILRCPKLHPETWLVASIDRVELRDIVTGTLGCPHCMSEYPIRDGIVYFDDDVVRRDAPPPSEAEAFRVAAALDLTDPRMVAVLHADWGAQAPLVRGIAAAQLLLVNPPQGLVSGDGVSIVIARRAPLAQASVDAVAIGADATGAMVESLRGSLRAGKRILGPISLPLPADVSELARDTSAWVGQLDAQVVTSAPIMPTRRAR
jgi:uncharacterized protein YbaR (Trm112 family)